MKYISEDTMPYKNIKSKAASLNPTANIRYLPNQCGKAATNPSTSLPIIPLSTSEQCRYSESVTAVVWSGLLCFTDSAFIAHNSIYTGKQDAMHDVQSCKGSSWVKVTDADVRRWPVMRLHFLLKQRVRRSKLRFFFLTRPGYSINMHRCPTVATH